MQTITIASHWVGLTLPGMIDEPGSFAGSVSSPSPQRGPGGQPAHVVGDLHQRHRERRAARPMRATIASSDALGGELVGRRHEGQAGQLGDLGGDLLGRSPAGAFSPVPTAVPPAASS